MDDGTADNYEVDLGPCPACGALMECQTSVPDNPRSGGPDPGSVLLCWDCAAPALVTELGTLRHPTPQERSMLALDVRFQVTRGLLLQNLRERP